jgi:hypothetical protein
VLPGREQNRRVVSCSFGFNLFIAEMLARRLSRRIVPRVGYPLARPCNVRTAFTRANSTHRTTPLPSDKPSLSQYGKVAAGILSVCAGYQAFSSSEKASAWFIHNAPEPQASSPPIIKAKDVGLALDGFKPLSQDEVTLALNQHIWGRCCMEDGKGSAKDTRFGGLVAYHGSQVASNHPCEDTYIHGHFSPSGASSKDWLAFGIFDGHLGSQTSGALSRDLVPYVGRTLSKLPSFGSDQDVQAAITSAFVALDSEYVKMADEIMGSASLTWAEKVARVSGGSNGSCALLSLYDPTSHKLHVACTGDSRAIVGRLNSTTGKW